jgi:tRNA(Ile)-lysidine synthase TilS/MesJ
MYAYEKDIILAVKRHDIPVVESPCPADKKTKREYAKRLISSIEKDIPNVRGNILRALENKDQMYLWFKK